MRNTRRARKSPTRGGALASRRRQERARVMLLTTKNSCTPRKPRLLKRFTVHGSSWTIGKAWLAMTSVTA